MQCCPRVIRGSKNMKSASTSKPLPYNSVTVCKCIIFSRVCFNTHSLIRIPIFSLIPPSYSIRTNKRCPTLWPCPVWRLLSYYVWWEMRCSTDVSWWWPNVERRHSSLHFTSYRQDPISLFDMIWGRKIRWVWVSCIQSPGEMSSFYF